MENSNVLGNDIMPILRHLPSQQAIIVIWEKGYYADLYSVELVDGYWKLIDQMPANVGRNGMGKTKEGDQKSPIGLFSLGTAFGNAPKPEGTNYPYRLLTPQDFWVDDSRSKYYNEWVKYEEDGVEGLG